MRRNRHTLGALVQPSRRAGHDFTCTESLNRSEFRRYQRLKRSKLTLLPTRKKLTTFRSSKTSYSLGKLARVGVPTPHPKSYDAPTPGIEVKKLSWKDGVSRMERSVIYWHDEHIKYTTTTILFTKECHPLTPTATPICIKSVINRGIHSMECLIQMTTAAVARIRGTKTIETWSSSLVLIDKKFWGWVLYDTSSQTPTLSCLSYPTAGKCTVVSLIPPSGYSSIVHNSLLLQLVVAYAVCIQIFFIKMYQYNNSWDTTQELTLEWRMPKLSTRLENQVHNSITCM